ncbi:MAG TPA: hypothetical protein VN711_01430, partial [Candidatus Saccharimonadales bacterium]|nr:hypothetical protein [Candidatus Saccharimonadales bacterium]
SQSQPPVQSTIQSAILLNDTYFSALPITGNLYLKNTGITLFPSQTFFVSTASLLPRQQNLITPPIPPFGSAMVPFSFDKTPFLTNTTSPITIAMNGKTYTKTIHISTFTSLQLIFGGITLGILCIIILIFARRTWRVSIFRPRE